MDAGPAHNPADGDIYALDCCDQSDFHRNGIIACEGTVVRQSVCFADFVSGKMFCKTSFDSGQDSGKTCSQGVKD